jgi:hypothetical protein
MKKIAFLFLIIDNPNFPKIWDSYFRGHKDKYSIYIHPKFPLKTTWKKDRIIKNLKETGWGYIVEAYIELLKEAYKDPDNYKFVTISESCLPIKSFDHFYNDATNDMRSWIKFMKIKDYNWSERIKKDNKYKNNLPKNFHFIKHYARFCLNREHVRELLEKQKELNFFYNMHVGDEFFLSVLYPIKNVKDFEVTFDDWEYVYKEKRRIKEEKKKLYEEQEKYKIDKSKELKELQNLYNNIAKNPKLITNINNEVDNIKNCNSYFYRKFSKDSNPNNIHPWKLK